jgi:hypothetical protein
MTKMTVVFRNFAHAPKNVFSAITPFNLKITCKKIERKTALDPPANSTADLLIVQSKKAKSPRAKLSTTP